MLRTDLDFEFPESLIATSPQRPSRVMQVGPGLEPQEISLDQLIELPQAGDVWILNQTKVLKRRVFAGDLEILFLNEVSPLHWNVLFPSKAFKVGDHIELPEGVTMTLTQKGRPQVVQVSAALTREYFERHGEVPLPPYIQKARAERHNTPQDESWYQTFWAENPGSLAAPTASLHFERRHLERLSAKGVHVLPVTLHVGLGTFLPVTAENLKDHLMHSEEVEVPLATWERIQLARAQGHRIWAMGTTVARSLESVPAHKLIKTSEAFRGETDLLILPGFEFRVVDCLMTNFHQPQSTLLALVAAFSSLERVKACYQWAIARKFRLFSYGDLSVWIK
jgi:S-adenosylmethionine:tRNA ribosyltransferase-isomerase